MFWSIVTFSKAQLDQWRLQRGGQLIIMAGMERMQLYQTYRNQCVWYHSTPTNTTSLSSPIKVPPSSCELDIIPHIEPSHTRVHWASQPGNKPSGVHDCILFSRTVVPSGVKYYLSSVFVYLYFTIYIWQFNGLLKVVIVKCTRCNFEIG